MNLIRIIEDASLNAWPPLKQQVLDGWLLRFADGYTRRANSVNAIYAGAAYPNAQDAGEKVAQKITQCESIYADSPLGCVFKITPLAQPDDLDALLA